MKKSESTSTLERDCREFVKWETGQYDSLPRKSHQEVMDEWESQGYLDFEFIDSENSNSAKAKPKKARKKKEKQNNNEARQIKRRISEKKRKDYIEFYQEAKIYESTDVCRSVPEKKHLLIDYFPYRFTKKQPLNNYSPAEIGSLFSKLLKYTRTITEETIAIAQAQQAQQLKN